MASFWEVLFFLSIELRLIDEENLSLVFNAPNSHKKEWGPPVLNALVHSYLVGCFFLTSTLKPQGTCLLQKVSQK